MSYKHRVIQQEFPLTGLRVLWLNVSRSGRCKAATGNIRCPPDGNVSSGLTATTRKQRLGLTLPRANRSAALGRLVQWCPSGGGTTLLTSAQGNLAQGFTLPHQDDDEEGEVPPAVVCLSAMKGLVNGAKRVKERNVSARYTEPPQYAKNKQTHK